MKLKQETQSKSFFDSVEEGDLQEVLKYLKRDPSCLFLRNDYQETALHRAALLGNIKLVMLLKNNQNIQMEDIFGFTPFARAAMSGHRDLLPFLGNLTDTPDKNGSTPLMWACARHHSDVISYLLKVGGNIDHRNLFGMTALSECALRGYTHLCQVLLENGAIIDIPDNHLQTPLHKALWKQYPETAYYLLDSGADADFADENGFTPIMWASKWGFEEVVKILIEKGANVHQTSIRGQSALMEAANRGHVNILKILESITCSSC
ncbi:ankyrin repeat domain-containing protein [Myxococcota bacterium]|nr:ankyrin repeat domain-containing protein [Myxococcota bacterium]MBU1382599.1 ankyrin repeat domain-containing protein [Myxococcota bacterium]MBU1495816.1 ankyrin repeat domain-containing protein [Myxococcota bacterium]